MATITQNDITFNNVKQTMDFGSGPVGIAGQTGVDPEWGGVINAIDIDWNDAQIADTTVSTTGQLLNIINELNNEVNLLKIQVGADPNQIQLSGPKTENNSYWSYSSNEGYTGYTLYGNNAILNVTAKLSYVYEDKEYNPLNKLVGWRLQTMNHTTLDSYFNFDGMTISGNVNSIGVKPNLTGQVLSYLKTQLGLRYFTFDAYSVSNGAVNDSINIKIEDGRIGEFTTNITDIDGTAYYTSYGVIEVSGTHNCFYAPTVNISIGNRDTNLNENSYIRLVDPKYITGDGGILIDNMVQTVSLSSTTNGPTYCYVCVISNPNENITVPVSISLLNNDSYVIAAINDKNVSFIKTNKEPSNTPSTDTGGSDTPGSDEPV